MLSKCPDCQPQVVQPAVLPDRDFLQYMNPYPEKNAPPFALTLPTRVAVFVLIFRAFMVDTDAPAAKTLTGKSSKISTRIRMAEADLIRFFILITVLSTIHDYFGRKTIACCPLCALLRSYLKGSHSFTLSSMI